VTFSEQCSASTAASSLGPLPATPGEVGKLVGLSLAPLRTRPWETLAGRAGKAKGRGSAGSHPREPTPPATAARAGGEGAGVRSLPTARSEGGEGTGGMRGRGDMAACEGERARVWRRGN